MQSAKVQWLCQIAICRHCRDGFLCQHETLGLDPLKGSKDLHSPGWMAAPIPPVHNQTGCTGKVGSEIWIWFKLDFWWHGPIRYHYHRLLEKIKMGRKGSHRKPIPQTKRDEFRNTAQKLQYSCMHGHVIWDWLSNISWFWKEIYPTQFQRLIQMKGSRAGG